MFVVGKLMELHGEGGASSAAAKPAGEGGDTGAKVERADGYEPPVQESVWAQSVALNKKCKSKTVFVSSSPVLYATGLYQLLEGHTFSGIRNHF